MTNRPCLDMNKAIRLIEEQCKELGADERPYTRLLESCFIGWYSRSVASCLFVFCKNEAGSWCVLASERGEGAADFQGCWNCPCGYLDFDETTAMCARRECYEETGVDLDASKFKFISYEDDPVTANRQNITFRFYTIIRDKKTSDFIFSHAANEEKEVGKIKWIPVEDIHQYKWAFNHDKRIDEIFNEVFEDSASYRYWKRFKHKLSKFWNELWYMY